MDRFLGNNLRENSKLEKNMQNVFFRQITKTNCAIFNQGQFVRLVKIDAIEDKFRQMVLIILSSNRYFFVNG